MCAPLCGPFIAHPPPTPPHVQRIMDNRDALRSTFAAYQETGDSEAYKTALRDLSKTLDSIVVRKGCDVVG